MLFTALAMGALPTSQPARSVKFGQVGQCDTLRERTLTHRLTHIRTYTRTHKLTILSFFLSLSLSLSLSLREDTHPHTLTHYNPNPQSPKATPTPPTRAALPVILPHHLQRVQCSSPVQSSSPVDPKAAARRQLEHSASPTQL